MVGAVGQGREAENRSMTEPTYQMELFIMVLVMHGRRVMAGHGDEVGDEAEVDMWPNGAAHTGSATCAQHGCFGAGAQPSEDYLFNCTTRRFCVGVVRPLVYWVTVTLYASAAAYEWQMLHPAWDAAELYLCSLS